MISRRSDEIARALNGKTKRLCFILGALGRQGNSGVLDRLIKKVEGIFEHMVLIATEVNVELLTAIEVDFFVQIACPRLSIDWSYGTPKPLLTPYELYALIDKYDFK
jgi:2-(3-amino-3-carboxypropyl)histidine synthase